MSANAALALPPEPVMTVHSDLLGPLAVTADDLFTFPLGLFGFPECRRFVLVPAARRGVYWLQSADYGTLAFLLVDPFLVHDGFVVDLASSDLAELHADSNSPPSVAILSIVTLPAVRGEQCTANLQGPLALNMRERVGKQLAISDSEFGIRCPIELPS
jgi:flagellar assembly factor FliW